MCCNYCVSSRSLPPAHFKQGRQALRLPKRNWHPRPVYRGSTSSPGKNSSHITKATGTDSNAWYLPTVLRQETWTELLNSTHNDKFPQQTGDQPYGDHQFIAGRIEGQSATADQFSHAGQLQGRNLAEAGTGHPSVTIYKTHGLMKDRAVSASTGNTMSDSSSTTTDQQLQDIKRRKS